MRHCLVLRHHAPCLCMKFHACSTYTTLKLGGGVQAASLSGQTSNVHQGPTRLDKKVHTHTCLRMCDEKACPLCSRCELRREARATETCCPLGFCVLIHTFGCYWVILIQTHSAVSPPPAGGAGPSVETYRITLWKFRARPTGTRAV